MIDDLRGVTVRPATNADCRRIQQLVLGVLAEFGLSPDLEGTDRDITNIEANFAARGGVFDVLETDDGTLVGSVGLYPLDAETVELRKMYFAPEIRGCGLGKKILGRTIEKARNMGYMRIYLETASVLKQAVRLYEGFGFQPVDTRHTPRCDQGYVLELVGK